MRLTTAEMVCSQIDRHFKGPERRQVFVTKGRGDERPKAVGNAINLCKLGVGRRESKMENFPSEYQRDRRSRSAWQQFQDFRRS